MRRLRLQHGTLLENMHVDDASLITHHSVSPPFDHDFIFSRTLSTTSIADSATAEIDSRVGAMPLHGSEQRERLLHVVRNWSAVFGSVDQTGLGPKEQHVRLFSSLNIYLSRFTLDIPCSSTIFGRSARRTLPQCCRSLLLHDFYHTSKLMK